ncbi:hypothetical protein ACKGJY_10955 [Hyunsoonleella sp. 2307UL5-6]|uniref:hypothetical protein n=1 Tax=Hyunsoonleella sp. 2307UL5-6 TaxID=3384768 RepID=UPI0039BD71D3
MKQILYSLVIIAIIAVFSLGKLTNDITIPFFPILFLVLGLFLFKKLESHLFCLSISINLIIASIFCLENYYNYGLLYRMGSDAENFYIYTLELSKLNIKHILGFERMELYYLINTSIYHLLSFVGIKSISFFHTLSLNIFLGALIPIITYRVGNLLSFKENYVKKAAIITAFFPLINYFSAVGYRDVWINLIFMIFMYQYYSFKKGNKKALIFLILILVITFGIRGHNVLFFLILPLIDQLIIISNVKHRNIFLIAFVVVFIVLFFFLKKQFFHFYSFYDTYLIKSNSTNSIGVYLSKESGIMGKLLYVFQYIIGPFPPRFMKEISISAVYLSIGNIFGFLIMPLYFYLVLKTQKYQTLIAKYTLYVLVTGFLIAIITTHLRHKIYLYPLIILFTVNLIDKLDFRKIKKFIKYELIVYFILFLTYCYLKYY